MSPHIKLIEICSGENGSFCFTELRKLQLQEKPSSEATLYNHLTNNFCSAFADKHFAKIFLRIALLCNILTHALAISLYKSSEEVSRNLNEIGKDRFLSATINARESTSTV